jgi:peptide/nickel transport system ATP-binding protein
MYLGRIVEVTDSHSIYEQPLHPYTKSLLAAIPIPDPFVEEKRDCSFIKGEIPSPLNPPAGCTFHPRCPLAVSECKEVVPPLRDVGENHEVACIKV